MFDEKRAELAKPHTLDTSSPRGRHKLKAYSNYALRSLQLAAIRHLKLLRAPQTGTQDVMQVLDDMTVADRTSERSELRARIAPIELDPPAMGRPK